ncbi:MAG: hypothetical protein ACM3PY_13740 [Omnitrophica WOR_2 bacterium]
MKVNTFLTIAAVLAALFGLAFLLAPAQIVAIYGNTLNESGLFIARYLGSAFLGAAVITWMARRLTSWEALRPVILGDFVLSLTGLIVALWEGFSGNSNALIWVNVVLYLFLVAGFGYFQFLASPKSSIATQ